MENNKRELIKKIKNDLILSEKEKNRKIQELMMGNYLELQTKSNESKTCSHYQKLCYKFYFDCCKTYDPCKRCHGERKCAFKDKLVVSTITCSECELSQEPGEFCVGCGIKFSKSFCSKCYIWTSKVITHCVKCGLCRLGKADSMFHCDDCGACFAKSVDCERSDTHECIRKKIPNIKSGYKDGICVVCSENTFDSQSESFPLTCGHLIHQVCWKQYIQQGSYKCPHCKKSIGDLTTHWNFIRNQIKAYPLPNDFIPIQTGDIVDTIFGKFAIVSIKTISGVQMFTGQFLNLNINKSNKAFGTLNLNSVKKNHYKDIHCNDCEKKSTTIYHPYGLECVECGSFNTQG